jgi:hypothetical protein
VVVSPLAAAARSEVKGALAEQLQVPASAPRGQGMLAAFGCGLWVGVAAGLRGGPGRGAGRTRVARSGSRAGGGSCGEVGVRWSPIPGCCLARGHRRRPGPCDTNTFQPLGATSLPAAVPDADRLGGDLELAGDLGLTDTGGEQLSRPQPAGLQAVAFSLCRRAARDSWHGLDPPWPGGPAPTPACSQHPHGLCRRLPVTSSDPGPALCWPATGPQPCPDGGRSGSADGQSADRSGSFQLPLPRWGPA